ncbi:MAG: DHH family phosphoesterase [Clostridia bacterium]|nr:DHH family phosphoesterase [Clostridia bacterium]
MEKKLFKKTLLPVITIDFVIMLCMGVVTVLFKKPYLYFGLGFLGLAIISRVFHWLFSEKNAKTEFKKLQTNIEQEIDDMTKSFEHGSPLLLCLVDIDGKLIWSNDKFAAVFEDQTAFDELAGRSFVNIFFDQEESIEEIVVEDKVYSVSAKTVQRHDGSMARMLFWQNVTARETIKQLYIDSRACMALLDIDNYDEIIESSPSEEQSTIAAEIDRAIREWAHEIDASVAKVKDSRYSMTFENKYMNALREGKFAILDRMHEIQTKADFPTTISLGIAVGESELSKLQESAEDALDLAQARGGDQAVVRLKGGAAEYYGGNLPTVEKRNKGKSRVIAHQLTSAIEASDKVIVMGHAKPDLDAFGAAMGMLSLCENIGVAAALVLDEPSDGIATAYESAVESKEFVFISHEQALTSVTANTLVIAVDHHIAAISECPELLEKARRIVIIDHHRKSANAIENALLTHMEVYASSTSELVTEILQYSRSKGKVSKAVAEYLLAGIMLDTKNFSINTGVRTFDAAAFLKDKGAENKVLRSYFRMNLELYQKKAAIIANAEILSNGVAVSYTRDTDPSMNIICAQAADELLDMHGVVAAFVAGRMEDYTAVSARSLGKVNVQTIMEQLGGGGHQNVAAAQTKVSPEESIAQVVSIMRSNEML